MVPADSDRISPVPPYSGYPPSCRSYVYGTFTFFGWLFQNHSTYFIDTLGLIRVRSPLLAESLIVFFSSRYLDVSVPWVTVLRRRVFNPPGFPIRTSMDQWLFAPPHSFSQLITSFVVSESLGIPRTPLFASYSLPIKAYL